MKKCGQNAFIQHTYSSSQAQAHKHLPSLEKELKEWFVFLWFILFSFCLGITNPAKLHFLMLVWRLRGPKNTKARGPSTLGDCYCQNRDVGRTSIGVTWATSWHPVFNTFMVTINYLHIRPICWPLRRDGL